MGQITNGSQNWPLMTGEGGENKNGRTAGRPAWNGNCRICAGGTGRMLAVLAFASALGVPTHHQALQLLTGRPAVDPAELDIIARHPEDSVIPLSPEALAGSPLLQPRMMLSNGCAMSTITLKTSTEILNLHQPAGAAEYELTRCANNRFCNSTVAQELYNRSAQAIPAGAIAMQLAAGYFAAVHNATLVFKGEVPYLNFAAETEGEKLGADGTLDALRELGTHTVHVLRTNALDAILCEVHDCMGNPEMGYQINRSTHERVSPEHNEDKASTTETACNNWRRALPSEEQPLVHLNVSRLRQAIDSQFEHSSNSTLTRLAGPSRGLESGHLKVIDSRTLLAWQEDKNEATLQRSLAAWLALLEAWGVAPNATAVRSYLVENGWGERPAVPKEETIANYAEVCGRGTTF